MAAPFMINRLDLNEVSTLVQECRIIDRINCRYMTPFRYKEEQREQEAVTMMKVISRATARAVKLMACINEAMASFRLLTDRES